METSQFAVFSYAIGSAFLFALIFLFRKQAAITIPIHIAFIIELAVATLILGFLIFLFSNKKDFSGLNSQGILFATLAGISLVAAVFLNYLALHFGTLSKIISLSSPAQIIFGVLIGVFLLKDSLSIPQIVGVVLSIAGILLVSGK
ncbi:EamA family transporter [Candidatus Gottesmanbacteria bacterium]|nr:EamA family transporter [Candidatus Gottesmanbacteria bacterium]